MIVYSMLCGANAGVIGELAHGKMKLLPEWQAAINVARIVLMLYRQFWEACSWHHPITGLDAVFQESLEA